MTKHRVWDGKRMWHSSESDNPYRLWPDGTLCYDESSTDHNARALQFTGLLDSEGTEIYEGDRGMFDGQECVVHIGPYSWEVVNSRPFEKPDVFELFGPHLCFEEDDVIPIERPTSVLIIGNIYENPDLV